MYLEAMVVVVVVVVHSTQFFSFLSIPVISLHTTYDIRHTAYELQHSWFGLCDVIILTPRWQQGGIQYPMFSEVPWIFVCTVSEKEYMRAVDHKWNPPVFTTYYISIAYNILFTTSYLLSTTCYLLLAIYYLLSKYS